MRRVSSSMLLVGSLPAPSAESALRQGAELFDGLVFALPDGETGPLSHWVRLERDLTSDGIEVIPGSGTPAGPMRTPFDGKRERIRSGVTKIRFASWPRIDAAIASWRIFARLQDEGAIPPGVRFQVGLPFPFSAMSSRFPRTGDCAIAEAAYTELFAREVARLTREVPAGRLAVQFDVAYEFLYLWGVHPVVRDAPEQAWDRFARPVRALARVIPEDALLGYHLCCGTFPSWPMHEPADMSMLVQAANYAVRCSGRPVDWLHIAGPPVTRSEDWRYYRPLGGLVPGDARVFLGIVLPVDGEAGVLRRARTAALFRDDGTDGFGVAMYCGFGRQPGPDGTQTMREHARVIRAYEKLRAAELQ